MRSLITPMLLISLGLHGAFLLTPTSQEAKSSETDTEIAQETEVENRFLSNSNRETELSSSNRIESTSIPQPAARAVSPTTAQAQTTQTTPRRQATRTRTTRSSNRNTRSSTSRQRRYTAQKSSSNTTFTTTRETSSNNTSIVASTKKSVTSNSRSANSNTTAVRSRSSNIPIFTNSNSANSNPVTNSSVISRLAPANSVSNSNVPAIIARTQNQDERVKNRLEFLKTFPRYPQAQWGLENMVSSAQTEEIFYRINTRDNIKEVARKFNEELLPQSQFSGELNVDEQGWKVYQVFNDQDTQYLHLISQGKNTVIFLANEELSREDLIKWVVIKQDLVNKEKLTVKKVLASKVFTN